MCAMDRASEIDIEEAYACGVKAVKLAEEGFSGGMVSITRTSNNPYKIELNSVPFGEVALKVRLMDDVFINKQGNFVTDEFIKYIKPLVGKIPEYGELRLEKVDF